MTPPDTREQGPLGSLALSRATVDRSTGHRPDDAWVERAWANPATRVLVVQDSRTLARSSGDGLELLYIPSAQAPAGTRFLLGVDDDEVAYFGVSGSLYADRPSEYKSVSLRAVGAELSDRDAGLFTHAVALANWHDSHTHCPQCGTPTEPAPAGHLTRCPKDETEHFPRLDPAVIMLVIDADDRCLLARNATWPQGRMSVLAGFVEPGESIEHAVAREVFEETSIEVGDIRYLGSQPWPMPRSLMLGFQSAARGGQEIQVDGDEIADARWFTRQQLRAGIDNGDLAIAPTSSIARRLIEYWYGEPLPDSPGAWSTTAR